MTLCGVRPFAASVSVALAAVCVLAVVSSVSAGAVDALSPWFGPGGPIKQAFSFPAPLSGETLNDPVVDFFGNVLISLSAGAVYSLNGQTGSKIWSYTYISTNGSGLSVPVPTTFGAVMVGTRHGMFALDSLRGISLWAFGDGLTTTLPSTTVVDPVLNQVYLAGRGTPTGGTLYAFNGASGQQTWSASTPGGTSTVLAINNAQVAQVLVGYPGLGVTAGSLSATGYDSGAGTQLWYKPLVSSFLVQMFLFSLDSNGLLYVGYTSPGNVVTIQCLVPASNGAMAWTLTTSATNPYATIGTYNLYIASKAGLTAYSLAGARPGVPPSALWTSTNGLSGINTPVIGAPGDGYVYIVTGGLSSVRLAALNNATGTLLWEFSDPDAKGVFTAPTVDAAGIVYIESFSNGGSTAYALDPVKGTVLWKYRVDSNKNVYMDTALAVGNGYLYLGDDYQVVAVTHGSASGSNAGQIAGAVVGSLLGAAAIAGAVWYFKFRKPRSGYIDAGYAYTSSNI